MEDPLAADTTLKETEGELLSVFHDFLSSFIT